VATVGLAKFANLVAFGLGTVPDFRAIDLARRAGATTKPEAASA